MIRLLLITILLCIVLTHSQGSDLSSSIISYVRSKPNLSSDSLREYIQDLPGAPFNSSTLYRLSQNVLTQLSIEHDHTPSLWLSRSNAYNETLQSLIASSLIDHFRPHHLILEVVKQSGGSSVPAAHFDSAVISGLGLPYDPFSHSALPISSLTFSSMDGYVPARLGLAYKNFHGYGVPGDCKKAASLLVSTIKQELEVGNLDFDQGKKGFYRLVEHSPSLKQTIDQKYKLPLDLLKLKARHDPSAANLLGEVNYRGLGGERDLGTAVNMMERAANHGDPQAMVNLAWMNVFGQGVDQNNKTALRLFAEAHDMGNSDGTAGLGYCYLNGIGVRKNLVKAEEFFVRSVEKGSTVGKFWLGFSLWKGLLEPVVKKDPVLARSLFSEAATQGHFVASFYLSSMILTGEGGPADCPQAINILNRLVLHLKPVLEVLDSMQRAYLSRQYSLALFYASKAAYMGSEEGWASLAFMLRREPLPPYWKDKLTFALERSSDLGGIDSMVWLGKLYQNHKDYKKAVGYFELASKHSSPEGSFRLACLFEQGLGVERDFDMAKRYFDICAQKEKIIGFIGLFKMRIHGFWRYLKYREPLGQWWFFKKKPLPAVYEEAEPELQDNDLWIEMLDLEFPLLIIFTLVLLIATQFLIIRRRRNRR
ncbi:hypothetical protein P9112_006681 [Eukaryota sp. TZLM1-RC]